MGGLGGPGPNFFFWSCQIWGQKFFPLFSALDSISTGGGWGGPGPNFFFLVMPDLRSKIFSLYLVLWTLFPQMGGLGGPGPNFFFWSCQIWGQKFFPLFSTLDSISTGGVLGPNFFWSCQIWGQKFFPLFSTLDSISRWWGGGVWDPTFFGHAKFEVKIFSLYVVLWTLFPQGGWGGSGTQLFLVMSNLRSKIFPFI